MPAKAGSGIDSLQQLSAFENLTHEVGAVILSKKQIAGSNPAVPIL